MQNQMTLEQILSQIKENQKFLDTELKPYDPKTKTGIHSPEIARRQANENIAQLRSQYLVRLEQVSAKILAVGGTIEQQKAARQVATEQDALVVTPAKVYDQIIQGLKPFMTGNKLGVRAATELESLVAQLFSNYAPSSTWPRVPMTHYESTFNDLEELVPVIQEMIEKHQSQPILANIMKIAALGEAQRLEFADEPVGIVVVGVTQADLATFENSFFPGRPTVVVDLSTVTNVEAALRAAGKALSKQMGLPTDEEVPPAPTNPEVVDQKQDEEPAGETDAETPPATETPKTNKAPVPTKSKK